MGRTIPSYRIASEKFHEGTCQGGHPVDIPEGCDNDLITDPGESDNKRQDDN